MSMGRLLDWLSPTSPSGKDPALLTRKNEYFLQNLRSYSDLWNIVLTEDCVVCIPVSLNFGDSIPKELIKAHILLVDKFHDGQFVSLKDGKYFINGSFIIGKERKVKITITESLNVITKDIIIYKIQQSLVKCKWDANDEYEGYKINVVNKYIAMIKSFPSAEKSFVCLDKFLNECSNKLISGKTNIIQSEDNCDINNRSLSVTSDDEQHQQSHNIKSLELENQKESDISVNTQSNATSTALLALLYQQQYLNHFENHLELATLAESLLEKWQQVTSRLATVGSLSPRESSVNFGSSSSSSNQEFIEQIVESYMMYSIHDSLLIYMERKHIRYKLSLQNALFHAKQLTQSDLGIQFQLQAPQLNAVRELLKISECKTPVEKMMILVNTVNIIHENVDVSVRKNFPYDCDTIEMSTDDMIPILVYVIVQCYPRYQNIYLDIEYITHYRFMNSSQSELGYVFCHFQVALEWLMKRLMFTQSSNISGNRGSDENAISVLNGTTAFATDEVLLEFTADDNDSSNLLRGTVSSAVSVATEVQQHQAQQSDVLPEPICQRSMRLINQQISELTNVGNVAHIINELKVSLSGSKVLVYKNRRQLLSGSDTASSVSLAPEPHHLTILLEHTNQPCNLSLIQGHSDYFAAITADNSLFTWGDCGSGTGRLGHGIEAELNCPNDTLTTPREVRGLGLLEKIMHVACGQNHMLAVSASGQLYSWGENRCGQLGRSYNDSNSIKGSTNNNNSVFGNILSSSSNNVVTATDEATESAVNGTYEYFTTPGLIEDSLSHVRVKAVACGAYHSLCLTADGEVYSWGRAAHGQLGRDVLTVSLSNSSSISQGMTTERLPGLVECDWWRQSWSVPTDSSAIHIVSVTSSPSPLSETMRNMSADHLLKSLDPSSHQLQQQRPVLSSEYSLTHPSLHSSSSKPTSNGTTPISNVTNNQAKLRSSSKVSSPPIPSPTSPRSPMTRHRVVSLAAGHSHSLAVTEAGAVFSWGCGLYGRLGHGHHCSESKPKQIMSLSGGHPSTHTHIVSVAAGVAHSMFLSASGVLYGCGLNSSNQVESIRSSEIIADASVASLSSSSKSTDDDTTSASVLVPRMLNHVGSTHAVGCGAKSRVKSVSCGDRFTAAMNMSMLNDTVNEPSSDHNQIVVWGEYNWATNNNTEIKSEDTNKTTKNRTNTNTWIPQKVTCSGHSIAVIMTSQQYLENTV